MVNTEGRTILVDDNRVEPAMGSSTGDAAMQARDQADRWAGQVQGMWGQVADEVREFTAEQPFAALLTAVGLGAVVGFFTTRR